MALTNKLQLPHKSGGMAAVLGVIVEAQGVGQVWTSGRPTMSA